MRCAARPPSSWGNRPRSPRQPLFPPPPSNPHPHPHAHTGQDLAYLREAAALSGASAGGFAAVACVCVPCVRACTHSTLPRPAGATTCVSGCVCALRRRTAQCGPAGPCACLLAWARTPATHARKPAAPRLCLHAVLDTHGLGTRAHKGSTTHAHTRRPDPAPPQRGVHPGRSGWQAPGLSAPAGSSECARASRGSSSRVSWD